MGGLMRRLRRKHKERKAKDESKEEEVEEAVQEARAVLDTDIIMISGCEDHQTSADVSNVGDFQLPDVAGRAGGACTSTLLNVLYKDEETPAEVYSFIEVLGMMREKLDNKGFSQIPQLTSTKALDLSHKFDLVPDHFEGTKRALMIGINYVGHDPGELRGCHNDVGNMANYIRKVHGFEDENITILMDDGDHTEPTRDNIVAAYKQIVSDAQPGDSIFLHYSGHGAKIRDDDYGEEEDGYDETLVPLDYRESGMIRDDDLFDIIVKGLPVGVHVVSLMDCCHSGSVLDLPYTFKANGEFEKLEFDEKFDIDKIRAGLSSLIGSFLK